MFNLMNNIVKNKTKNPEKITSNNVSFCQFKNEFFWGLLQNQFLLQNDISRVNDPMFVLKLIVKRKS